MTTIHLTLLAIAAASLSACAVQKDAKLPDPSQRVLISGAPTLERSRVQHGAVGELPLIIPTTVPQVDRRVLPKGNVKANESLALDDAIRPKITAAPLVEKSVATALIPANPTPLSTVARVSENTTGGEKKASQLEMKNTLAEAFASKQTEVRFAFATSALGPQGKREIAQIAQLAKVAKSINLLGATDATGDVKANQVLAMARAHSVAKELEQYGIPSHRMLAKACVDTCATRKSHEENRRVEVELVVPIKVLALHGGQRMLIASR